MGEPATDEELDAFLKELPPHDDKGLTIGLKERHAQVVTQIQHLHHRCSLPEQSEEKKKVLRTEMKMLLSKKNDMAALAKKFGVALALAAFAFLGGCCAINKDSVASVGRSQDIINAAFLKYVDADTTLDAKKKTDWHDLVTSEVKLRADLGK